MSKRRSIRDGRCCCSLSEASHLFDGEGFSLEAEASCERLRQALHAVRAGIEDNRWLWDAHSVDFLEALDRLLDVANAERILNVEY